MAESEIDIAALVEAGARASYAGTKAAAAGRRWESIPEFSKEGYRSEVRAILTAVLPLVLAKVGIDNATRLAIICGNADWDGERICATCDGKGYVNE